MKIKLLFSWITAQNKTWLHTNELVIRLLRLWPLFCLKLSVCKQTKPINLTITVDNAVTLHCVFNCYITMAWIILYYFVYRLPDVKTTLCLCATRAVSLILSVFNRSVVLSTIGAASQQQNHHRARKCLLTTTVINHMNALQDRVKRILVVSTLGVL